MRHALIIVSVLAIVGCGEDSSVVPCEGPNGPCIEITPGPDVQQEAQRALIEAAQGDVIIFRAGQYDFTGDLSLDVDGVTVRGEGMDETILSFAGQTSGAQGILVTGDNVTFEDLAIEDTAGDALKYEGVSGVTIRRVRVEWTNGPDSDNGAYGLYPVQCQDVLIEDSIAIAASDAGIYVGQSENVIVRGSRAEMNVAGIEIENTIGADVYDNVATGNTGGLLIFSLPGLQVSNGARTRAYRNQIYDNNTDNFAPEGNIVGMVPRGSGVVIMAGHEIELFENDIRDHLTGNMAIISYLATQIEYDDPDYNPYSDTVYAYDNTFGPGGQEPIGVMGGYMRVALDAAPEPPEDVPSIVFDGFVDPTKAEEGDPRRFLPEYNLCFENNGDATFANLDFPFDFEMVSLDPTPHQCSHPKLPAISIPGAE